MNMHWIDWTIVSSLAVIMALGAWFTKRYTLSVADFLSANRCGGRYLLGVAEGIAALGAISVVGKFEMFSRAGFTIVWWEALMIPVGTVIAITGWVVYRFRQTRAMTLSQYFEIRYSRNFRVFAGMLAFGAGVLNFGIFPAVGARFFIHFCGLPDTTAVFALVMAILLSISLAFTYLGGQIAVMITDFLQGMFCNIMFAILALYLLFKFNWSQISEALLSADPDASMLHPFKTTATKNFDAWYFVIGAIGLFYGCMAWQGAQGYNSSAKSAHEAKMGKVIGILRIFTQALALVLLPICAYTFLHHPDFSDQAQQAYSTIGQINGETLQRQCTVSIALTHILPIGIVGGFCAVMFAAFVSTHDTYLHSWGSIFIQDVILPLRKKPMTPKQHLLYLRLSIMAVAVFIFLFSLIFNQKQDILMFLVLTGTIFGGAGASIVGGLYWKRGTTAAAWTSLLTGVVIAVCGWYLTYYWAHFQSVIQSHLPRIWDRWAVLQAEEFPVNSQRLFFLTMLTSATSYLLVSLLGRKQVFNLDRMLHRGEYAPKKQPSSDAPSRGLRVLAMGSDFTLGDKVVYIAAYVYIALFFGTFVVGTFYNLVIDRDVSDETWLGFWHGYVWFMLIVSIIVTVWLSVGGLCDVKKLFAALHVAKRDDRDDGRVVNHHNLDEE